VLCFLAVAAAMAVVDLRAERRQKIPAYGVHHGHCEIHHLE
jgi:hypothetical protein